MKSALLALVLMAPIFAQAATPETLECNVITNGNGKSWENVMTFSTPLKEKDTSMAKTFVTSYGATFAVDASAMVYPIPEMNGLKSYSMTMHVALNELTTLTAMDLTMGNKPKTTGNILDTSSIFSIKNSTGKTVSYNATCAIKPSKN